MLTDQHLSIVNNCTMPVNTQFAGTPWTRDADDARFHVDKALIDPGGWITGRNVQRELLSDIILIEAKKGRRGSV